MSSSVSTHSVFAVVTTDLFPLKKFGGQDARNSVGNVWKSKYVFIFNKCILFDCRLLRSVSLDLPLIPEEDILFFTCSLHAEVSDLRYRPVLLELAVIQWQEGMFLMGNFFEL